MVHATQTLLRTSRRVPLPWRVRPSDEVRHALEHPVTGRSIRGAIVVESQSAKVHGQGHRAIVVKGASTAPAEVGGVPESLRTVTRIRLAFVRQARIRLALIVERVVPCLAEHVGGLVSVERGGRAEFPGCGDSNSANRVVEVHCGQRLFLKISETFTPLLPWRKRFDVSPFDVPLWHEHGVGPIYVVDIEE